MSLGATLNAGSNTPDPLQRLAAAVLALAVDDLGTKKHQHDARQFLYSGTAEVFAGLMGADSMTIYNRLKKHIERQGIVCAPPPMPRRGRGGKATGPQPRPMP